MRLRPPSIRTPDGDVVVFDFQIAEGAEFIVVGGAAGFRDGCCCWDRVGVVRIVVVGRVFCLGGGVVMMV